MTYRYIPEPRSRVKLSTWSDYSIFSLPTWAWLEVLSVNESNNTVNVELLNGLAKTGTILDVPLSAIDSPIGWQERYTIHVSPEKVFDVLAWLPRGIAVRAFHDLSCAGRTAFQPADNCGAPHWSMPELTDVVPPSQTRDRIRIVS